MPTIDKMKPIAVTLSGGGTRLYAHLGVLLACEELGLDVAEVLGVSGGALVAAAWTCIGSTRTRALLKAMPVRTLKRWGWFANCGLWDNAAIVEACRANGVTWAAARDSGRRFGVGVAALEPGVSLVWRPENHPVSVTLAEACRISASIPFLWGYTRMAKGDLDFSANQLPADARLPDLITLADGGCANLMLPGEGMPWVASNIAFNGYRTSSISGWVDLAAQILATYQYRTMAAAIVGAVAVVNHRTLRAVGWLDDFGPAEIDGLIDSAKVEALAVLAPLVR
jgi:hypothetical protein